MWNVTLTFKRNGITRRRVYRMPSHYIMSHLRMWTRMYIIVNVVAVPIRSA